jgi:hypothetical protein
MECDREPQPEEVEANLTAAPPPRGAGHGLLLAGGNRAVARLIGRRTAEAGKRLAAIEIQRPVVGVQRLAGSRTVSASLARQTPGQDAGRVADAISKKSATAVASLTKDDFAKATDDQRIDMIGIVLAGGRGDALPLLWDSFGGGPETAATAHPNEWKQSLTDHADDMSKSKNVLELERSFKDDIAQVAQAYLTENDALIKSEMEKLGIPQTDGGGASPTDAQAQALQKEQAAAGDLEQAQKAREALRETVIAFHDKPVEKGGSELPEGGVENIEHTYEPVLFDPDRRFDAAEQPTDYLPGVRTWEETNEQQADLTNLIKAFFMAHPALYAISRGDGSGARAGAVNQATPAEARRLLGDQLRTVLQNIESARGVVATLALQMTPIQEQLLTGRIGARVDLKTDWSTPFRRPLGSYAQARQAPGPWWEELGAATLQAAAYAVVSLASGGMGAVLLAGGQAAISIGEYQALEAASRANVTPDTALITDGEVSAAACRAIMDVALAFIAAAAAAKAALAARALSQAGRALAAELGEKAARNLLLELTPDAAQALKQKLGVDVLRDLAERLGGKAIQKLAGELSGAEIQALVNDVGFEALEKLSKDLGGKAVQGLASSIGGSALKALAEEISAADIQAMIAKHGSETVKWLAAGLRGNAAKALSDELSTDVLKAMADIDSKAAADLVQELGNVPVHRLAGALKGTGLQNLSKLDMFKFDKKFASAIAKATAVKGLGPLDDLTLTEIENKLKAAGFTKTASNADQDFWTHTDGSVVRVKVGPNALRGQRSMPHLVREISKTPGQFGTRDIIAKVTEDGTAVPAGSKHADAELKQWFNKLVKRQPTPSETAALEQVWADAGHANVTIP